MNWRDVWGEGSRVDQGRTMNEWISVDDRLPEDKGDGVKHQEIDLWCGEDKCRYPDAYYFKGKFWDIALDHDGCFDFYFELENITHWMPLPQPPEQT